MDALGTHLVLDMRECSPELLDDLPYIKQAMVAAAKEAGATIVGESFHRFNPGGVTGVVAIAESHLCIHTWPEHGYAAVDIFTCGKGLRPHEAAQAVIEKLRCGSPSVTELRRGPLPETTASPA